MRTCDTSDLFLFANRIANFTALFSMSLGRFAVIALLVVLQGNVCVQWKKALIGVGVAQFLANMVQIGFTVHQCDPVDKLWKIQSPGDCKNATLVRQLGFFSGSMGAFADFFLAVYPALLLIGPLQQMKLSLRIAICFILGGGAIAGIAGVVKTAYLGDIERIQTDYADIITWIL